MTKKRLSNLRAHTKQQDDVLENVTSEKDIEIAAKNDEIAKLKAQLETQSRSIQDKKAKELAYKSQLGEAMLMLAYNTTCDTTTVC